MQLRVVSDQPWNVPADVLVLPFVGDPAFEGELAEIDRRAGGELHVLAGFRELRSERYASALSSAGQLPVGRILAIAAGPAAGLDRETAVRLGAAMQRRLAGRPVRRLAVWLGAVAASLEGGAEAAAELITRGIVEGSYDPAALYGTGEAIPEEGPPAIEELILIVALAATAAAATRAAERGVVVGEGTNLTRGLANRSANDVTPKVLADEARALAAAHGLAVDVLDEKQAAKLGMGMFLAVGQGSVNPPRMIVLRSGGKGETDAAGRRLALVGKGVCFDSGGISIKPADRMDEMKTDKTGACTVLAAAVTAARLAPGIPLLAIAP
ncbi:MAG TPA: hypothetical protein VIK16_06560, partial [Candidatus Limnocylindrales bacterium]